jgi:hypothetical protein
MTGDGRGGGDANDVGDGDDGGIDAGDGTGVHGDDDGDRGRPCPLCATPMFRRHCKYVCPRHGVVYDCSDTFY